VALTVKQTQKIEGRVGLFRVPIEVELTNATGPKLYPIVVSKAEETFTFPSDSVPQMVLFDKGTQVLKSVEFKKDKREWLYQLKNAGELADRADAAVTLGKLKGDEEAAAALGEALQKDKASGVRQVAAEALGDLGGPAAVKQLLSALPNVTEPEVRSTVVRMLGDSPENPEVNAKLEGIAKEDASYRARAAALQAIGKRKSPNAYETLVAAVNGDSPDGILRNAALGGLGTLEDDRGVPLLREWTGAGKESASREAAIRSLARVRKDDHELTSFLAGYLKDPNFRIRVTTLFSLGTRGDAAAIPALEAMLKNGDLSIEMAPRIKSQIERLKNPAGRDGPHSAVGGENDASRSEANNDQRLSHLEQLVQEMNERLKAIEGRLPAAK